MIVIKIYIQHITYIVGVDKPQYLPCCDGKVLGWYAPPPRCRAEDEYSLNDFHDVTCLITKDKLNISKQIMNNMNKRTIVLKVVMQSDPISSSIEILKWN